jgi:RNA polymerase sigma-70 factor (ECF subfamily)
MMSQMQTQRAVEARKAPGALPGKTRTRRTPQAVYDEEELVERLKDQDPEALKSTMRKYRARLLAVANRICNNPADAEEVVQDVFVTAQNKIDRFEGRSTLATWLHRITVNTALMKLRNQRLVHKNSVPMDDAYAALAEREGGPILGRNARPPDETYLIRELCEQIRQTVEGLPEPYKEVFLLRGIQGLSTKETGKILNVTPGAIKSRLHRSRDLIRERLDPYLD